MPRNLDHRVEMAVPIAPPELRAELLDVLQRAFADNQNSWQLDASGAWHRLSPGPGEEPRSLQGELIELHTRRAAEDRAGQQESVAQDTAPAREDLAASIASAPGATRRSPADW